MSERIYYRRNEIAKILCVDYVTIVRWVKEGYIKEYRINKSSNTPLYNLNEILATLQNSKV